MLLSSRSGCKCSAMLFVQFKCHCLMQFCLVQKTNNMGLQTEQSFCQFPFHTKLVKYFNNFQAFVWNPFQRLLPKFWCHEDRRCDKYIYIWPNRIHSSCYNAWLLKSSKPNRLHNEKSTLPNLVSHYFHILLNTQPEQKWEEKRNKIQRGRISSKNQT